MYHLLLPCGPQARCYIMDGGRAFSVLRTTSSSDNSNPKHISEEAHKRANCARQEILTVLSFIFFHRLKS